MLNWIWAGILLAATLASYYIALRRFEGNPNDSGVGLLIGAITGCLALGCVRESVLYPVIALVAGWVPEPGTGLYALTVGVILLAAVAFYFAVLYCAAKGLVAVSRRRHGLVQASATSPT